MTDVITKTTKLTPTTTISKSPSPFRLPEYLPLHLMLIIIGYLIVYFNVKGYEILFHAESIPFIVLFDISPFGLLLGATELAVLLWTSSLIKAWSTSNFILKIAMFVLIPAFWFLCYVGINSYLDSLAIAEIRKVEETKLLHANNEQYLSTLASSVEKFERQLSELRNTQSIIGQQITVKNTKIQKLNAQASERRKGAVDCSAIADCASSVNAFDNQASRIESDVKSLNSTRTQNQLQLTSLQNKLANAQDQIDQRKLENTQSINAVAGTESNFILKKAAYEKAIVSVLSILGITVEQPFNLFMMLISGLIYPVYFLLNLLISLNSEENRKVREKKQEKKKNKHQLLRTIIKVLRARVLRKKQTGIKNLADIIKARRKHQSHRSKLYIKLIKYLQVWAHRRQKTQKNR